MQYCLKYSLSTLVDASDGTMVTRCNGMYVKEGGYYSVLRSCTHACHVAAFLPACLASCWACVAEPS